MQRISCLLLVFIEMLFGNLQAQSYEALAEDVHIRRTTYGVPHIQASNLKGVAFGLAWCELEDYGDRVIWPLIAAKGELAKIGGYDLIENDFANQLGYQLSLEKYPYLDQDTRDLLEGFAAGVNYYLSLHLDSFPQFNGYHFSGQDVAATTTHIMTSLRGENFKERLIRQKAIRDSLKLTESGSNAWAFAPTRTRSGNTILVRNPHLRWSAGYYEAHLIVEGKLNFYGDFRIGGLFAIIGGFNEHLGWATTNNHPDLDEVYALEVHPRKIDHYILNGLSIPLQRRMLTVVFKNGEGMSQESREFLFTPYGPVIHRDEGKIYILKHAGNGVYRRGDQFTRMMLARNLEEWKDAMRLQAITSSNYTYADAEGNIFYVWNAMTPAISHLSGGDTAAISVQSSAQIWSHFVPFDSLPQLLNPPGGYLHNENDPFHFTNLNSILSPTDYPPHFPKPRLRQRSQHSLQLIHNNTQFSLEEVVELKHSMKMLLADQLTDDLIQAVRSSRPSKEERKAITHIQNWDRTVKAGSKGGILFESWFIKYAKLMGNRELFAIPWSFEKPMKTPNGLADPNLATLAFTQAIEELTTKYGSWDLAWGDVHRLRHGQLDLPVSGGPGGLGCFRVLWFEDTKDAKRQIRGGDGWQLAVEFSNPPKAYSILAYGQSNKPHSPHHADQATLFAHNKMKAVAWTESAIKQALISSYKPGKH